MPTRTFTVSPTEAKQSLLDWLRARLRLSREAAEELLKGRKVRLGGALCSNPAWRLRAGQRIEVEVSRNPSPAPSPKRRGGARARPRRDRAPTKGPGLAPPLLSGEGARGEGLPPRPAL